MDVKRALSGLLFLAAIGAVLVYGQRIIKGLEVKTGV